MSEDASQPVIGRVVAATQVVTGGLGPVRARNVVLLLAASVALMMVGFGIIQPVFGRRLGEFGSGVEALGLMTMSFALGQLVAGPYMGTLADRFGRRPLVLLALAGYAAANVGFLFAPNAAALVGLRAFEGVVTAGLFPAAMGVVADIFPEEKRGQWVGIIMGAYGAGFIFGPVAGGILYDVWGFEAPFVASAALAFVAFVAAAIFVPETNTRQVRRRTRLRRRRNDAGAAADAARWWTSIPKPLHLFATMLLIDFSLVFAFAFIEPQLVFYVYEDLQWTTVQLGVVVGVYGIAMVLGQAFLGRASDRFGRGPVILLGIVMTTGLYVGLVFVSSFPILMLIAAFAGLGLALATPALSSLYIDVTEERHLSRVLGLKQSAAAFGGVRGRGRSVAARRGRWRGISAGHLWGCGRRDAFCGAAGDIRAAATAPTPRGVGRSCLAAVAQPGACGAKQLARYRRARKFGTIARAIGTVTSDRRPWGSWSRLSSTKRST